MRCTWCQRKVDEWSLSADALPDCGRERCTAATRDVRLAVQALRRGEPPGVAYLAARAAARAAALRCGPVDWTRPVEGWTLWGDP